MGMAASQVNFLGLTDRKANVIRQQQKLSNQKMALTRDMQKISQEYQRGLNEKVLKWSNNSGASYEALSYKNLMTPSTMNLNKAYLLTDMNDKILVDSSYKKYAEMISANGRAGGNWSGVQRAQILSELTGISFEKISSKVAAEEAKEEAHADLHDKMYGEPNISYKSSTRELLEKMGDGKVANGEKSWKDAYNTSTYKISIGKGSSATSTLGGLIDQLSSKLSPYFVDGADKFTKACNYVKDEYTSFLNDQQDMSKSGGFITGNNNDGYEVNIHDLVEYILATYIENGGDYLDSETGYADDERIIWYDIDSEKYQEQKKEHDEWLTQKENAENNYNSAEEYNSTLLTAEEESLINFYDEIFSAIAEKGWTYNDNLHDTEYLNQMLQNNLYTITTVDRNSCYDRDNKELVYENEYVTRIADNFDKIFTVNDSDAREEALAEYEYKKNLINQKETRIDLRMQDLSTELSAINQMMQGIETVKKDNIERNFSIFG